MTNQFDEPIRIARIDPRRRDLACPDATGSGSFLPQNTERLPAGRRRYKNLAHAYCRHISTLQMGHNQMEKFQRARAGLLDCDGFRWPNIHA